MSEFRIFCISAAVFWGVFKILGTPIGDAAVQGSAASCLLSLYLLAFGGVLGVMLFGKWNETGK